MLKTKPKASVAQTEVKDWTELEHSVGTKLRADPTVREVYSQFPTVEYRDENGVLRTHRFDFTVVKHDNSEIHFDVRHSSRADELRTILRLLKEQGIGMDCRLLTEREVAPARFRRTRELLRERERSLEAEYRQALPSLEDVDGEVAFEELLKSVADVANPPLILTRMQDRGVIVAVPPRDASTNTHFVIVDHNRRMEELRRA